MIIEEDCNDGKRLWLLKGIMIIKKYCDYWRVLWSLKNVWLLRNIVIIEEYYNHWTYCDYRKILCWLKNIVIKTFSNEKNLVAI